MEPAGGPFWAEGSDGDAADADHMSATPAIRTADTAVTSVDFRRMGSPLDRGPFVQEFRADPSDTRVVQSWAGRCQVRIPIGNRRLLLRRVRPAAPKSSVSLPAYRAEDGCCHLPTTGSGTAGPPMTAIPFISIFCRHRDHSSIPEKRHTAAQLGHATSTDLKS